MTAGIISAHNRDIGSGPYDYLQIDAAVNRGNSGGPSFDLDGKVVGMNTAIFSPSRRQCRHRLRRAGALWCKEVVHAAARRTAPSIAAGSASSSRM